MMRLWSAVFIVALGCGVSACAVKPPPAPAISPTKSSIPQMTPGSGFWPTYLRVLKGEQLPDQACHPKDLSELMLPCDEPGSK